MFVFPQREPIFTVICLMMFQAPEDVAAPHQRHLEKHHQQRPRDDLLHVKHCHRTANFSLKQAMLKVS